MWRSRASSIRKRRARRAGLMLLAAAAIAGAWSVYWTLAATRMETEIERRLRALGAQGASLACSERRVTGFPLRFRFECDAPQSRATGMQQRFEARAPGLTATASALSPQRLRIEVAAPLELDVERPPGHSEARAITRLSTVLRMQRLRLVLEHGSEAIRLLTLDLGGFRGAVAAWRGRTQAHVINIAGESLTARLVRGAGNDDSGEHLRLSLAASGLSQRIEPPLHPLADRVEMQSLTLAARANRPEALRGPGWPARLRTWRTAGGTIAIERLAAVSGPVEARAEGTLGLAADGRPEGKLATAVLGLDSILQQLIDAREIDEEAAILVLTTAGLMSAKAAAQDGRIRIKASFHKGGFYYGPFRLFDLPALF